MDVDLPPRRTADLDGTIAYREWAGPAGSTFVLVHGLGGMHLNWVRVAPGLAGLGRVFALDLPGFGASPLQGRRATMMALRRSLHRFVDEIRLVVDRLDLDVRRQRVAVSQGRKRREHAVDHRGSARSR